MCTQSRASRLSYICALNLEYHDTKRNVPCQASAWRHRFDGDTAGRSRGMEGHQDLRTSSPTHLQGPSPHRDWLPRGQTRCELLPETWGRATRLRFYGRDGLSQREQPLERVPETHSGSAVSLLTGEDSPSSALRGSFCTSWIRFIGF